VRKHGPWALSLTAGTAVLLGVWLAGRDANPGPLGFPLDDAWIHMVYGRGLLESGFLVYNPGVPSTGCTSPLWAMVLAIVHAIVGRVGAPDAAVAAVLLTGASLHLACIAAGVALARQVTGSAAAATVAGLLLAAATPLAASAYFGMEVGLTALLLLLGARDVAAGAPLRGGAWLALAGLARPESAVVTLTLAGLAGLAAAGAARREGADSGAAASPVAVATRVLAPSLVAGLAFVAYDLWASGAPLPATFYAKRSGGVPDLPRRLAVALLYMLPAVPPLSLGWLALLGFLPSAARADDAAHATALSLAAATPLAAGLAFLLANLLVMEPVDPAAFYHLRYVLPAVPLLLVALAVGAERLGGRLGGRVAFAPGALLIGLSLLGAARTLEPVSHHLHNDVRNINEVQRRLGEWLALEYAPGTWIAASDAGAVRYFSGLPTVDVIGLNTPEIRAPGDAFIRRHPVAAIALMPAWFESPDEDALEVVFEASTEHYTVTSMPEMRRQIVARAKVNAGAGGTRRVRFAGYHDFELDFLVGADTAPRSLSSGRGGRGRSGPRAGWCSYRTRCRTSRRPWRASPAP
jgi:hypothetical protein